MRVRSIEVVPECYFRAFIRIVFRELDCDRLNRKNAVRTGAICSPSTTQTGIDMRYQRHIVVEVILNPNDTRMRQYLAHRSLNCGG